MKSRLRNAIILRILGDVARCAEWNRFRRGRWAIAIGMLAVAAWGPPAAAIFGVGTAAVVAKEWTQLANNVELVFIAGQEVQQLQAQIRQYEWMVRQGERLEGFVKRDAIGDLRRLSEIVAFGSEVADNGAAVDALLREAFPGYEHYATGGGSYADDYRRWNTRRMDAVRQAYYAADLHAGQFRDENAAAREIERQMETATGQMQVLQASGQLAGLEVEQLQKLRQLMSVQIRMQGQIVAAESDRAAAEDANLDEERAAAERMAEAARRSRERERERAGSVWSGNDPWGEG